MARFIDRQKAIKLRKQGKTYSEIRSELKTAKSTLSDWLAKIPLTSKQVHNLEKSRKRNKFLSIEKIRFTKQIKRENRINAIYKKEQKRWLTLSQKDLELAGLFLYWGEGNKRIDGPVFINNTDPKVMQFTLYWYTHVLCVPSDKIKVDLHLYSDMNIKKTINFWSKTLGLPVSQFRKPYIKQNTRENIDHKGFGYGTCGLAVNDVRLKEKTMMAIKAISDKYSAKIEAMI